MCLAWLCFTTPEIWSGLPEGTSVPVYSHQHQDLAPQVMLIVRGGERLDSRTLLYPDRVKAALAAYKLPKGAGALRAALCQGTAFQHEEGQGVMLKGASG